MDGIHEIGKYNLWLPMIDPGIQNNGLDLFTEPLHPGPKFLYHPSSDPFSS